MTAVIVVLAVLTGVVVIATALPLVRHGHWAVRLGDFPRLQVASLAALVVVAVVAVFDPAGPAFWILGGLALVCGIYQLIWIWPYTPFHRREVRHAEPTERVYRLRVMVANVLTPNRQSERLLTLVRQHNPDVLVAVETDDWWESRLDALLPNYPECLRCPKDNLYGMHVYSRLPLEDAVIQYLVEDDVPSMHTGVRLPSGDRIQLHCLHPAPPSPTENETSDERDAELVLVGRSLETTPEPVIVTGDLNDVAWSGTTRLFRRASDLLDPRIGRGLYNSFHAKWPLLRWPLDHVFHSDHFTLVEMRRLPAFGSDHFPILFELALQPRFRGHQHSPEREDGDHAAEREVLETTATDTDEVHHPR